MGRTLSGFLVIIFALVAAAVSFADETGTMQLKAGDEVYVCGCGEGCNCLTMSMQAGKCACGKDLIKAKVTKVEGDKATLLVNGQERVFSMTGKYACACGPQCKCSTISQHPGKCACGKDMKQVKGK